MNTSSKGFTLRGDSRTPVLVALILTMALVAMDTTIVATAIPQVVDDLGGFTMVGWVFSIYLLAQTVTIPIYGKLADSYGRKPVLIAGVVLFLTGSLLSAVSWDMVALIAFRALQGLGAGSIGATVNTVAGDLYNVEERGRIQGYLSSVWGISAVAAPALGGLFAQYASWRWIFLVNLPVGTLALVLILRRLHETVERRRHRIDYAGAALVLVCAGSLIFGLLQGGVAWSWTSPPSIITFLVAMVTAAGAVLVERRAREPVLPLSLWTQRLTAGSYVAMMTAGLMVIGLSVYLPNWAQTVLGLSPVAAGFVLAVMSVSWPIASGLSSRLYLRIGFRDTALVGSAFTVTSGVLFSLIGPHAAVWQPALGSVLLGTGMGLIISPLLVGLQSTVGWAQRGVITGGAMFARFLGQSIGAAVFGAITNSVLHADAHEELALRTHASTHAVFLGLLVAAAVTTVILLALVPRHFPSHSPQESDSETRQPSR